LAGYDPQTAITFWQRMAAQSSNKTSEFLSDHPSDETRIRQIQGWMPEALQYYKKGGTTSATAIKATTTTTPKTTKTLHISSKKK
jgi:predicted Zn-dependent protease